MYAAHMRDLEQKLQNSVWSPALICYILAMKKSEKSEPYSEHYSSLP